MAVLAQNSWGSGDAGVSSSGHDVQSEPVSLRYELGGPLLLVFGMAAAGLAAFWHTQDKSEAGVIGPAIVGVLGFLFIFAAAMIFRARARSRFRLTLDGGMLSLVRGVDNRTLRVEEITSVTLDETRLLSNGTDLGLKRTINIRTPTDSIDLKHAALLNRADKMGGLLNALFSSLADSLDRRRKDGGAVLTGKGWKLDNEGLHFPAGAPGIPLDSFGAADIFESKASFWFRGEEVPRVSVPAKSENARLLLAIVTRNLPKVEEVADPSSLGRVLFKTAQSLRVVGWVLVLAGLGTIGFVVATQVPYPENIAVGAGGLFVAFIGLALARSRFRCHERGVVRESLFGTRSVNYRDIDSFTYRAVRMYHNGAYTGTSINMTFTPAPPGKSVSVGKQVRGNDEDLDFLRDTVSRIVADRMMRELQKGSGQVKWGNNAWLRPNEIAFRKSKLLGKGDWMSLSYPDSTRMQLAQGKLTMAGPDGKQVLAMGSDEANFYPGLLVYQQMMRRAPG